MKYLFIFTLICISNTLSAQDAMQQREFILQVVNPQKPFICANALDSFKVWQIKRRLNYDSLGYMRHGKWNGIILTKKERNYIDNELSKMEHPIWREQDIPYARILSRQFIDSILNNNDWSYFYKHYDSSGYYSFSHPIFIRDSVCIFYWGHYYGNLGASSTLTMYKKKNNQWSEWFELFSWIS